MFQLADQKHKGNFISKLLSKKAAVFFTLMPTFPYSIVCQYLLITEIPVVLPL